jgi:hypothetical protein
LYSVYKHETPDGKENLESMLDQNIGIAKKL